MTKREISEERLDALLAEAATRRPQPPASLLARIAADAEGVAREREAAEAAARETAHTAQAGRRMRGLLAALGGWPALAGLAAVALFGIGLGYAPPPGLQTVADNAFSLASGYDMEDFMTSFPALNGEG